MIWICTCHAGHPPQAEGNGDVAKMIALQGAIKFNGGGEGGIHKVHACRRERARLQKHAALSHRWSCQPLHRWMAYGQHQVHSSPETKT